MIYFAHFGFIDNFKSTGYMKVEYENKNKIAPIVFIGYDNSVMENVLSFSCEFGFAFIGGHKIKKIEPSGEMVSYLWNKPSA